MYGPIYFLFLTSITLKKKELKKQVFVSETLALTRITARSKSMQAKLIYFSIFLHAFFIKFNNSL